MKYLIFKNFSIYLKAEFSIDVMSELRPVLLRNKNHEYKKCLPSDLNNWKPDLLCAPFKLKKLARSHKPCTGLKIHFSSFFDLVKTLIYLTDF